VQFCAAPCRAYVTVWLLAAELLIFVYQHIGLGGVCLFVCSRRRAIPHGWFWFELVGLGFAAGFQCGGNATG
jgi:hypothetical protein